MIDMSVHLGDVIVTAGLAIVSFVGTRLYRTVKTVIEQHEQAIADIDDHAEVINMHTGILIAGGLVKGPIGVPRVAERRRLPRIYEHDRMM